MTVALLPSCWAQAFRPGLVTAVRQVAGLLGLDLVVPKTQTCCGLPAWDAGQLNAARVAALRTLDVFSAADHVVALSPACLRMLQQHIPALLDGQPAGAAARDLAARSGTWLAFLAGNASVERLQLSHEGPIALFEPCMDGDLASARRLLAQVNGATFLATHGQQCCGWGANLPWRHPHVSAAMAGPTVTDLVMGGARLVLTTDVGCLLHLDPLLTAAGGPRILHVAEFLALASA